MNLRKLNLKFIEIFRIITDTVCLVESREKRQYFLKFIQLLGTTTTN